MREAVALLVVAIASLVAIGPALAAIGLGVGVPPQQGFLFGSAALTLSVVVCGGAFQNRYVIWRQSTARLTRLFMIAGGAAVALLVGYLFVYNLCVIEHPLYTDKLLFPLWPSGRLAQMIGKAGSRYAAVETYGGAAVFDAISETPEGYAIALGVLLALYAPSLAITSGVAMTLALRHPLFRASGQRADTFDVFLCYHRADVLAVRSIANALSSGGHRCFLDETVNPPGQAWTEYVARAIDSSRAFAVFVGPSGIGQWQAIEIQNIVEVRLRRGAAVIPVFLPDAPADARLPMQLAGLTWVDFRRQDPDPMVQLIRGVEMPADPAADRSAESDVVPSRE